MMDINILTTIWTILQQLYNHVIQTDLEIMHDLSKYTVPTSFVGIAVPPKVVGMLVVLALPTKVVGMQASNQIQES